MKLYKLFLSAATGCLLVGASGAAMAQTVDCASGLIVGQQVDAIVSSAQPCHIEEVIVAGDVTITDSPELTMIDVEVKGSVVVTGGGRASLSRVDSFGGNVDVSNHTTAVVLGVIVRGGGDAVDNGNLVVDNNAAAVVQQNIVVGNLTCTGNIELDEFFNRVYGTENCSAAGPAPAPAQ